jgi:hypothetical protein
MPWNCFAAFFIIGNPKKILNKNRYLRCDLAGKLESVLKLKTYTVFLSGIVSFCVQV